MSLHTENFDKLANEWWDENGPMRPLHQMNPVRLKFIRDAVMASLPSPLTGEGDLRSKSDEGETRTPPSPTPSFGVLPLIPLPSRERGLFSHLTALDVGCGAGLLTEPLARMGFATTGLDLSAPNIEIAKKRNAEQGLGITYGSYDASELIAKGQQFDVVCALEVIEHVGDQAGFVKMCADLTRPGGLVFFSTLNKTIWSYLLAILGAEYVLRLLPIGTHDHSLFVAPHTLKGWMSDAGIMPTTTLGMQYNPLMGTWKTGADTSVNYIVVGIKS